MRKLKLQMSFENVSWDNQMVDFCLTNLENVDNILLGRKTAEGFIPYWLPCAPSFGYITSCIFSHKQL